MRDLIILVADKNMQFALDGLLQRHDSFQINPIQYDIYVHPRRDAGVYQEAVDFLRPFLNRSRYVLVFFDHEGSGQDDRSAAEITLEVKTSLERNGWQDRAEVIVFDPELEIWAWVNSFHLARHTGWESLQSLLEFVQERGYCDPESPKPNRPKEAFEAALREKRIPRSSSIYGKIAAGASFRGCRDPSFRKFKRVLRQWFGTTEVA